ncbi:hypothetical protein B0O99DRAFT_686896 [Bisporella sp. PMI_857]|nr:hypothetical protein B0O99DRAFT_686896 [Bisporella sp. PMI_857]
MPVFRESVINYSSQNNKEVLSLQCGDLTQISWLFMQLITLDSLQDFYYFVELYTSVFTNIDKTGIRRLFNALHEDLIFIGQARTLLKDDPPACEVQRGEKEYFAHSNLGAEALAGRLTEEAELDGGFIADSRLWEWVGKLLQY